MDTSASFLNSLQLASDDEAWDRLVGLYSPLIRGWLRRFGAAVDDIDDLVQEVLTVVFRRFPEFQKEPHAGAFRSWLRTIAANCLRDHWRKTNRRPKAVGGSDFVQMIDQLEDPHSGVSQLWNREHDQYVIQYLLEEIRPRFTSQTWSAFRQFALDGKSADAVSHELGMSINAVFIAKSRVMSCLRKQGQGLIDSNE
ncbi:sigma-70 family RNA polymerase sigma factor [Blastopirellula sp. J2-11]|uniref:RNA polymerase sigma factor n=1 Tax=Blastopirellula sp. J2-11 TaxID=2943192 RepID=UPI0021C76688|nr:sigma-70 family RNA polymerase sigma factor [Blastopirellula sp. J2-11]UUO06949.1 sigma-70 family RNA polymerase sigma factor [Blastopirellula sp. J2-11]